MKNTTALLKMIVLGMLMLVLGAVSAAQDLEPLPAPLPINADNSAVTPEVYIVYNGQPYAPQTINAFLHWYMPYDYFVRVKAKFVDLNTGEIIKFTLSPSCSYDQGKYKCQHNLATKGFDVLKDDRQYKLRIIAVMQSGTYRSSNIATSVNLIDDQVLISPAKGASLYTGMMITFTWEDMDAPDATYHTIKIKNMDTGEIVHKYRGDLESFCTYSTCSEYVTINVAGNYKWWIISENNYVKKVSAKQSFTVLPYTED